MEQTGSEWKETGSEITIREIVSWLTLSYLYCRIIPGSSTEYLRATRFLRIDGKYI